MLTRNIPKLKITKVGYLDKDGEPVGFSFCSKGIENSVGLFYDADRSLVLIGGYTIDELKEMCR